MVLTFAVYSTLGWWHELVFVAIAERRLRNPGLLYGPYLPIYGLGGLAATLVGRAIHDYPVLVLLVSGLLCGVIEYVGHVLLERLGVTLWDYRHRRWNLNGRVSLDYLVGFAAMATAAVYVVDPILQAQIGRLASGAANLAALVCAGALVADATLSLARRTRRRRREVLLGPRTA